MSPELKQFYVELQAWIDGGCLNHDVFSGRFGICRNLDRWVNHKNLGGMRLDLDLALSFIRRGLGSSYPWGVIAYYKSQTSNSIYKGRKRLAWIKEHAQ